MITLNSSVTRRTLTVLPQEKKAAGYQKKKSTLKDKGSNPRTEGVPSIFGTNKSRGNGRFRLRLFSVP